MPALPAPTGERPPWSGRDIAEATGAEATQLVSPAAIVLADANEHILHVEGEGFARHGLDSGGWIGGTLA